MVPYDIFVILRWMFPQNLGKIFSQKRILLQKMFRINASPKTIFHLQAYKNVPLFTLQYVFFQDLFGFGVTWALHHNLHHPTCFCTSYAFTSAYARFSGRVCQAAAVQPALDRLALGRWNGKRLCIVFLLIIWKSVILSYDPCLIFVPLVSDTLWAPLQPWPCTAPHIGTRLRYSSSSGSTRGQGWKQCKSNGNGAFISFKALLVVHVI